MLGKRTAKFTENCSSKHNLPKFMSEEKTVCMLVKIPKRLHQQMLEANQRGYFDAKGDQTIGDFVFD